MLLPTTQHPLVELVAKAHAADPAGAVQLLRLAAYDVLIDGLDDVGDEIRNDMAIAAFQQTIEARRGLVRSYLSKRATQGDVEPVLAAARVVQAMSSELVSKEGESTPGHPNFDPTKHPHGADGRWASVHNLVGAYVKGPDPHTDAKNKMTSVLERGKYGHLQAAGRVLQLSGNPVTSTVGLAADLAGALGPQAEKILGSRLQRAAYRYRGTELRPDKGFVSILDEDSANYVATLRQAKKDGGKTRVDTNRFFGTQAATSVAFLDSQVPSVDDYMLSKDSGKLPPSRGVILDDRGQLDSYVVGHDGDHYVPFNLKGLAGLQGGQYVRTRAAGGPTDEDFYTAVVGGARQMTVVSNSGVFTVKFDKDMRGGRRYSDGAARMVKRYQKLLDSVGSGRIVAQDISDDEKKALRHKVFDQYKNSSAADIQTEYERQLNGLRSRQKFSSGADEGESEALALARQQYVDTQVARHERQGMRSQAQREEIRRSAEHDFDRAHKESERDEAYRTLRLDGEGFHRALNALKQEFPQFIADVSVQERQDYLADHKVLNLAGGGLRPSGRRHAQTSTEQRVDMNRGTKTEVKGETGQTKIPGQDKEKSGSVMPMPERGTPLPEPAAASYGEALDSIPTHEGGELDKQMVELARVGIRQENQTEENWKLTEPTDIANNGPLFSIAFLMHEAKANGANTISLRAMRTKVLPKLTDEQATSLESKLNDLVDSEYDPSDDDYITEAEFDGSQEGAKALLKLLAVRNPFSPAGDVLEDAANVLGGAQPPERPEITRAGLSFDNLRVVGESLSPVAKEMAQMSLEDDDTDAMLTDHVRSYEASLQPNGPDQRDAKQSLEDALTGLSFARAWTTTQAARDLGIPKTGDGGDDPFSGAAGGAAHLMVASGQLKKPPLTLFSGGQSGTVSMRDNSVSPVAKAMQRALLARSSSPRATRVAKTTRLLATSRRPSDR